MYNIKPVPPQVVLDRIKSESSLENSVGLLAQIDLRLVDTLLLLVVVATKSKPSLSMVHL
jgi:hypothetical protein